MPNQGGILFVPFSAFNPDGGDYGAGLALAQNVLPVHGSHRPIQAKAQIVSKADGPVSAAYVHVYQQSRLVQYLRPDADTSVGSWIASTGTTLFDKLNETVADDSKYIICPNAPSAQSCRLSLSNPGSTSGTNHFIRWRYRVPATTGTWTVLFDLMYNANVSVTTITRSGSTATATVASTAALFNTQTVIIQGATQPEYNGRQTITVTDGTHFTFTVAGAPATPATGTITYTAVIATDTATSASAVAGWTQRELQLTGTQITAITDYTALFFQFTATVPGSLQFARPIGDVSAGGWVNQVAGTTNLYQSIDETVADNSDYIQSPSLSAGGAVKTYTAAATVIADPNTDSGLVWRYRYKALNAGVTVTARLKQGTTIVKENIHTSASTAYTDQATTLSTVEAALITDYTTLRIEFEAVWPTDVASTVAQFARPTSDVDNSNSWRNEVSSASNLYLSIDETSPDDGTTVVVSSAAIGGTPDAYYIAGLGAIADPVANSSHILSFRWKRAGTSSADLQVYLYCGANLISTVPLQSKAIGDGTWSTYVHTLSAAEADSITDYSQLRVKLVQPGLFDATRIFFVTWVEFQAPQPRAAVVSFTEFQVPSTSRAEVSWDEMEVPDGNTSYLGDTPTIFAGTRTKLYNVTASVWTDLSKGGGYAGASVNPAAWSFCSFGTHVIATNYVDAVQYRQDNAGNFKDLIVSALKPKARFCAAVRNYLMLGGISLSGHFDDEVWWSYIDDATQFDRNREFQSDYQRIVSQPGQIMGLVGGDFALVFKRRSIHALDWVGGQVVFKVRDLSGSIGTPFPRSIVSADGMVYFWGGSSFYRTDGYSVPQAIGSNVLSRFLADPDYSSGAIAQVQPANIGEEDQMMVGWFDPFSGLIIWVYQGLTDTLYKHTRAVIYSPREDRWTHALIDTANLAYGCTVPNVTTNETHLLKGSMLFDWDGTNSSWVKLSGGATNAVSFRTKRLNIGLDGVDTKIPQCARVCGVMPIFSVQTNDTTWPNITITVTSANDPRMLVNPTTQVYSTADANERGWFPHDLAGYYFQFQVDVPAMTSKMMVSFDGVYVRWEYGGEA